MDGDNILLDNGLSGSFGSDFDDDFAPFVYEPDPTLPDDRYFKLRGADGNTYLVRHDERADIWELTMRITPLAG